jgi:hypothetical protein
MFGEHYGSLLASSGALVDLEKELQSVYMSTKLYQFSLTWNLLNNSKSVENQKKMQLQKLFQITPSISTIFWKFFTPLSYFSGDNLISAVILLSVALRPTPDSPVGAVLPPSCHPSRHHSLRAC